MLPLCDLIVGTEEEIHILGGSVETIEALRDIRATDRRLAGLQARRRAAASPFPTTFPIDLEDGIFVPGFPVEVFNVLGAGDAFMAGFLRGWLARRAARALLRAGQCVRRDRRLAARLRAGHADQSSNSKHFSRRTDLPIRLREDVELEHLHWATTRRAGP